MKIAAVTHVRNDDFYLGKWVDHYGRLLGRENLHILLDGADWQPGVDLTGTNVTVVERQITRMNRVRSASVECCVGVGAGVPRVERI